MEGQALKDMEAAIIKSYRVNEAYPTGCSVIFNVKVSGKELDPVLCNEDLWIELNSTEYGHPLRVSGSASLV